MGYGSTTIPIDPINLQVGYAVTQTVPANTVIAGSGSTSVLDGYLKGLITEVGNAAITVKLVSHVSGAGTETAVDYQQAGTYQFSETGNLGIHTGELRRYGSWRGLAPATYSGVTTYTGSKDWFDQQTITLNNGTVVKWNQIAEKPGTSSYAAARNSRFDEIHVVAYDDSGTLTGNSGSILEKHVNLSKAKDSQYSAGSASYWRKVLEVGSDNLFGGSAPAGIVTTGFDTDQWDVFGDGGWDQNTENITFSCIGNFAGTLAGGKNYNGVVDINASNALNLDIGALSEAYDYLRDPDLYLSLIHI